MLAEAKRRNKPIFLDFHTLGFYPRQQIARQAALDPSLAQQFSACFINYLVGAKGAEGREIAQFMSTFESRDIAHRLNPLVRYYANNMTDPAELEQALTWSARSLAFDPCSGYQHLHARLLVRLGRAREADEVLQQDRAAKTPGTHQIHLSIKRPEDYDR